MCHLKQFLVSKSNWKTDFNEVKTIKVTQQLHRYVLVSSSVVKVYKLSQVKLVHITGTGLDDCETSRYYYQATGLCFRHIWRKVLDWLSRGMFRWVWWLHYQFHATPQSSQVPILAWSNCEVLDRRIRYIVCYWCTYDCCIGSKNSI